MYTQTGAADLTEPYWTVSGFYNGRARSEHLELGYALRYLVITPRWL